MGSVNVFAILQGICTIVSIVLNNFLIYIVRKYTKSSIGYYKYLIITFACFEMVYAVIVLVGMPINYLAENSWVVFNHDGLFGRTRINWLIAGLYCVFYEIWMGLVVAHFMYRYIVVCRPNIAHSFTVRWKWRIIFGIPYSIHFALCFTCGLFFCTRNTISPSLTKKIGEVFQIEEPDKIGYIILRAYDLEGNLSPGGIGVILNHYFIVITSVVIIGYTAMNLVITISRMRKSLAHAKEANIQTQMFVTLLIQTTIPFVLVHLPTLIYLCVPFFSKDFTFGEMSSIFAFLTSIPKVLDPIVVLSCIREYRRATIKIFCGNRFMATQVSSMQGNTNSNLSRKSTERCV